MQLSKPRIVGPPIRRLPPPNEESDLDSVPKGTSGIRLKMGEGAGVCPNNNLPLLINGKIVTCNGIEPNCPPKTYCFVTGVASGLYNCCRTY